jgi:DNA-directed RNA polymerase subunit RPC12/RpoP
MEQRKFCSSCGKWLPLSEFYYNSYRQRYEWVCKECFKKRVYKNKESRRKAFKKWYNKIKQDKVRWFQYINKKRLERYKRKKYKVKQADKLVKGLLYLIQQGRI